MKICIIPARGGSKRIPRKNIKDFMGKPMIAYSIEAALKSACFGRIIVIRLCMYWDIVNIHAKIIFS
jgi:N-acylneuraminate cytidylyltransferase